MAQTTGITVEPKYNIDIIIDKHVIIQNMDAIIIPKNLISIVKGFELKAKNLGSNYNEKVNDILKYETFYELANLIGVDKNNLFSPSKCAEEYLLNKLTLSSDHIEIFSLLKIYYSEYKRISDIPTHIMNLTKFALQYHSNLFEYLPNELKKDEKFLKEALKLNGLLLKYLEIFQDNLEMALVAVQENPLALRYVGNCEDKEMVVLQAVTRDGDILEYASEDMKKNERIVIAAVQNTPDSIMFANKCMRGNYKIMEAVVSQNGSMLRFASNELKGNEKLVLTALKQSLSGDDDPARHLKFASDNLKSKKDFVIKLMFTHNPESLKKYIDPDLIDKIIKDYGSTKQEIKEEYFNQLRDNLLNPKSISYLNPISEQQNIDNFKQKIEGIEDEFFDYAAQLNDEKLTECLKKIYPQFPVSTTRARSSNYK